MSRKGYVYLWRKAIDSDFFADPWLCKLWMWCMVRANYRAQRHNGIEIPVGSFMTGRAKAAEFLNVTESKLYRGLKRLQGMKQIRLKSNNRFTIVTVCNFKTYQPHLRSPRTTSEQPSNTIKEGQEYKNDSLDSEKPPKSSVWTNEDFCQSVLGDAHAISQTILTTTRDRIACCKAAYMVHSGKLPTPWLATSLSEAQRANADKPHAMFYKIMRDNAVQFGVLDFDAAWREITIPRAVWNLIRSTEQQQT